MNNEVTLEELDKNLRQTTKMASDNEQKLDELSRKLGVQEEELKRAIERAELAESKLKSIEEELLLNALELALGELGPLNGSLQLLLLDAELPGQLIQLLLIVRGHLGGL